MRRIILVGTVALVMAAMMVALALPALAAPPPTKGQFTCEKYDPFTGQYTVDDRVPRGQVADYERAGYYCYRSGQ